MEIVRTIDAAVKSLTGKGYTSAEIDIFTAGWQAHTLAVSGTPDVQKAKDWLTDNAWSEGDSPEEEQADLDEMLSSEIPEWVANFVAAETADLTQKINYLEAEAVEMRKMLTDCVTAIETLPPETFGIGNSSHGQTHWYIRDELIGRACTYLDKEATDGKS